MYFLIFFFFRLITRERSWSIPAIQLSLYLLWLCSGLIWSSVRPEDCHFSTREWSELKFLCVFILHTILLQDKKMYKQWRLLSFFQESSHDLWSVLWDFPCCFLDLLSRIGEGSSYAEPQVQNCVLLNWD